MHIPPDLGACSEKKQLHNKFDTLLATYRFAAEYYHSQTCIQNG